MRAAANDRASARAVAGVDLEPLRLGGQRPRPAHAHRVAEGGPWATPPQEALPRGRPGSGAPAGACRRGRVGGRRRDGTFAWAEHRPCAPCAATTRHRAVSSAGPCSCSVRVTSAGRPSATSRPAPRPRARRASTCRPLRAPRRGGRPGEGGRGRRVSPPPRARSSPSRQVRDAVAEHPALGRRRPLPVRVGHARARRIEGVLLRDQVVDQGTIGLVAIDPGSRALPTLRAPPRPRARSPLRGRRCMDGADAWTGYVAPGPEMPTWPTASHNSRNRRRSFF